MLRLGCAVLLVAAVACSPSVTGESTTSTPAPGTTIATTTTSEATTTTEMPTTTSTVVTTTTAEATTTSLPEFPRGAEGLQHGGESWAVYLAVAEDFSDPTLEEAVRLAESYGLFPGTGDLGCDQGAAEALRLDPDEFRAAVGLYFDSEQDALQAVAAFEARGHQVAGMGLVQTFCLD